MRQLVALLLLAPCLVSCAPKAQPQATPFSSFSAPALRPTEVEGITDKTIASIYACPKKGVAAPETPLTIKSIDGKKEAELPSNTECSEECYRLYFDPGQGNPVIIFLFKRSDGYYVRKQFIASLPWHDRKAAETSVEERQLSEKDWNDIRTFLKEGEFWNMATEDPNEGVFFDSSLWVIEARCGTVYHHVSRRSPSINSCYRALCVNIFRTLGYETLAY